EEEEEEEPARSVTEEGGDEEESSPWTYDTKEYPVVITVDHNFETAEMEATVTIDGDETTELTITNVYKAASTEATLEVKKEIEDTSGSAYDTTFTFTLKDSDGKTLGTATVVGAGTATFDPITYEEAGDYSYTITETKGSAAGYTYDTASYAVKVTVADEGGKLVATVAYGKDSSTELTVTNIYDPKDAEAELKARKVVDDQSDSAPDETFTFELVDEDGSVVETVSRKNGGYVNFSTLTFDHVGTYNYTIREVSGSTAGFTYDTDGRDVQIEVTDDGKGSLKAEVTYLTDEGEAVITNPYKAEPTSIKFGVAKKVKGLPEDAEAQEFTFVLKNSDGTVLQNLKLTGEGVAEFNKITYDKAGTYTYTVNEKKGSAAGYTYDSASYTVTVTVTDEGGKLKAAKEITKDGSAASVITFTNTYKAASVTVDLSGSKKLTGRDLAAGEFSFTLEIDGAAAETVTNAADGSITFSTLTFKEAGEHEFKIYEVKGSAEGVTYDETVYEGTITITDDGAGQLEASVEGAGDITFNNEYEKKEIPPGPPTGDGFNDIMWLMAMLAAILVLAGMAAVRARKRG
ncbi:MAG: hypothetical protein IJM62_08205, partial [Lachnospiraceae bacterium]|nr:hypothetical protein [Lachnospiraceae bacterium]